MTSATKWLPVFQKAIKHLRIQSKHAAKDPDGTGIPLKMWTSQRMVMEKIADGLERGVHVFYILKSRQLGVTTITLAIILFWLALHPNTIGIYVADNDGNAEKARATIKKYVESWHNFMGRSFSITKFNKHLIGFSNGSRLDIRVAGKTKTTWGEGEGYLVGHLTEVSKYGQAKGIDAFRAAMAPQNERSLYIFESTAYGMGLWCDLWQEALADPDSVCPIFVGWWSNETNTIPDHRPLYAKYNYAPTPQENDKLKAVRERFGVEITMSQLAWKRHSEQHNISGEATEEENQPWLPEDAFQETGLSFFQTKRVANRIDYILNLPEEESIRQGFGYVPWRFQLANEYHDSSLVQDPMDVDSAEVRMRIFEYPVEWEKNGQQPPMYSIGFDPAYGRNDWGNNHCCSVWRCFADKMVQVAEYAENDVTTVQAAWVLAWLAGRYYPCMVNIDLAGGLGLVIMQEFQNLRSRMQSDWYRQRLPPGKDFSDFLSAASWYLYHRADSPGPGYMYGTKTSHDLKFKMMNSLRDSFVTELLEIRSIPLLREMLNVRQDGPDIGAAARGREKDDRTFAMGLANMTWIEHIRPAMISNGITWESSIAVETGTATPVATKLNRIVQSVMVRASEEPQWERPRTLLEARGLV